MQPRQNRSWTSPFIAVACLLRKCVLSFPLIQISGKKKKKKKKTKDYNPKENKIHNYSDITDLLGSMHTKTMK